MQKVLRDHDVDKHGYYDHGGNGEEEDEPNDDNIYYSDDDSDSDPERYSKVAEDSTYASMSRPSNTDQAEGGKR
jgi:hypothetical protein